MKIALETDLELAEMKIEHAIGMVHAGRADEVLSWLEEIRAHIHDAKGEVL